MRVRIGAGRDVAVVAVLALVVFGCSSTGAPATETSVAPTSTTASQTAAPTASPAAASPEASPHALVGEWVGIHDCERIVSMLTDAGLDDYVGEAVIGNGLVPGVDSESDLLDPSSPCAEAVPQKHSHFFTAGGFFGSRDFLGRQVDDGSWRLEGDDVVVINGTPFRYRIEGDELTLEPPEVDLTSCGQPDCRFLATWVRMVAMPGTTWVRGTID